MPSESLVEDFLEAWGRTGAAYLTIEQIAKMFGYSKGWVQLMVIKTNAEPRVISSANRKRLECGLDLRLLNRERNLVKYCLKRSIQKLYEARADLLAAPDDAPGRRKLIVKNEKAEKTVKLYAERLNNLGSMDPILRDAEYWING